MIFAGEEGRIYGVYLLRISSCFASVSTCAKLTPVENTFYCHSTQIVSFGFFV